jgi:hypothetical protein
VLEVPMSARGEQEVQQAVNDWIADGGQAYGLVQGIPREWTPPLHNPGGPSSQ